MSTRSDDGGRGHPDDDWFAPSDRLDRVADDPSLELEPTEAREPEWEAEDEWEYVDGEVGKDVAHRHIGIVLAVLLAIFLVVAGFLVGRITTDATETVVTFTTTVESPPATTASESTPTESTSTDTTSTDTTSGGTTSTPTSNPTSVPTDATLRPGTKGSSSVATLQAALTSLGYSTGGADGSYGPSTVAAVTAFQTAKSLPADGVAGPTTLAAINTALARG